MMIAQRVNLPAVFGGRAVPVGTATENKCLGGFKIKRGRENFYE